MLLSMIRLSLVLVFTLTTTMATGEARPLQVQTSPDSICGQLVLITVSHSPGYSSFNANALISLGADHATYLLRKPIPDSIQTGRSYCFVDSELATERWSTSDGYEITDNIMDWSRIAPYAASSDPSIGMLNAGSEGIKDIQVRGTLAYLANGDAGLRIADVSNPASPRWRGAYDTDGYANRLELVGNLAFVADTEGGLKIIDIQNPDHLTLRRNYQEGGIVEDVQVVGNLAYLLTKANEVSGSLLIIDVSDLANPRLRGRVSYPYNIDGNAFDVVDQLVYITGGCSYRSNYMKIVNVANPDNPYQLGKYESGGDLCANGVQAVGKRVYLRDLYGNFDAVDVSTPASPKLLGRIYFDDQYA